MDLKCGSSPVLTGDYEDLTWTINAHRQKRSGEYEYFELRLKCCRWSIQRIARQIATMHERDRERLRQELRRIELEAEAIKQPDSK